MEANEKRFPCVEVRQCSLGRGVFAVAPVPKGESLLKIEGKYLNFEEQYQTEHEANVVQIGEDLYINPEAPGLYLNHSCDPNCYIDPELWLVASRHIKAGEQLLFDYSTSMLERDWEMKGCQCGSVLCRGTISDFDMLPVEVQDRYLRQGWVMDHVWRHRTLKLSLTMEAGQIGNLPAMRRPSPPSWGLPMTKTLSPNAQAVLDACDQTFDQCGTTAQGLAAALRAAADLVAPEQLGGPTGSGYRWGAWAAKFGVRAELLTIATELEFTPYTAVKQ